MDLVNGKKTLIKLSQINMKVYILRIKSMDLVYLLSHLEMFIKDNFKMINAKDMEK